MTEREALKLALEALENHSGNYKLNKAEGAKQEIAITAIKEALAQPEQEPVTWRYKIVDVFGRPAWTLKTPKSDTRVLESQPLYTTPPRRKPLTENEIKHLWYEACQTSLELTSQLIVHLARNIEAAHGIYAPTERKGEA